MIAAHVVLAIEVPRDVVVQAEVHVEVAWKLAWPTHNYMDQTQLVTKLLTMHARENCNNAFARA